MRTCSPDRPSVRSPDSPEPPVHLISAGSGRAARRHGFDATVASFVVECRSRGLSPRTIEFYLVGLLRPTIDA
jgi:hypothetical protein